MKMPKINIPFYIIRRQKTSNVRAWLIRGGAIIIAFLFAAILATALSPNHEFGKFFEGLFKGTFGSKNNSISLFSVIGIYLLLSLAVTPSFRMKFWNIGVEGQALAGGIVAAPILLLFPSSIPDAVVILIALFASIAAGIVWALIPTLFKVKFKTNETLFTLMMNYVAVALSGFTIASCSTQATQTFPLISKTHPGRILDHMIPGSGAPNLWIILIALVIFIIMIFYLNKTKHGFELSVIGDSINTARYVGMSVNKVAIRTMIMNGAIAGLTGFFVVACLEKGLTSNLMQGRGFSSILIAWLGHFNPSEILVYSVIMGIIDQGSTRAGDFIGVSSSEYFSGIIIGAFILFILVSEFFVRYQIKRRNKEKFEENVDSSERTVLVNGEKVTYKVSEFEKQEKKALIITTTKVEQESYEKNDLNKLDKKLEDDKAKKVKTSTKKHNTFKSKNNKTKFAKKNNRKKEGNK